MIPENNNSLIPEIYRVLSTSELKLFIQLYITLSIVIYFMSLAWKVIFHFIPLACFFPHLQGKGNVRELLGKKVSLLLSYLFETLHQPCPPTVTHRKPFI